MAKYLLQVNYVGEGVKGLLKEGGTSRRAAAEKAVASVGGKIDAMYFAFGRYDAYVLCEVPDMASATAMALTLNASGRVTCNTVPLITAEEVDQASKKSITYRAPGA